MVMSPTFSTCSSRGHAESMAQSSSLVLVVQLNYQYLLATQTLALEDDVDHSYLLTRLSGDNKADGWRHWRLQL